MKRKWRLVPLMLLICAVCAFCFRETLMVRLFPKVVLSRSISSAFNELESRFADSPIHLITNALEPSGCQNVEMKLDTNTQFLGVAHYDLELQTQADPNRIYAEGSVSTGSGIMDLKLYLDDNSIALSSENLTEGAFYGITHNTFSEDIRGFQLLSFLAGEETIAKWDASVAELAELMKMKLTPPEISRSDIQTALLGALVLNPEVTKEQGQHCYGISFTASGPELAQKAEPYLQQAPESIRKLVNALKAEADSSLKVVFHLNAQQLTALDAQLTLSGEAYEITVTEEGDLLRGQLRLRDGDNLDRWDVTLQTNSDENTYRERLVSTHTRNAVQNTFSAEYSWDLSSGDLALEVVKDGKKHPIRLNLKGEGQSFTMTCQEFEKICALFTGKENPQPAICTMTVSPGGPVLQIGDYKNISDWSMEDLSQLLRRIGGLVGIRIP